MPEWVFSVIGFVVATAIVTFFVQRMRTSEWKGELIKKRHNPGDMDTTESFSFVFRTDDGKKKRFQTKRVVFDTWNVGDRAEKVKGEYFPRRVE
jgi:hypothetical protein